MLCQKKHEGKVRNTIGGKQHSVFLFIRICFFSWTVFVLLPCVSFPSQVSGDSGCDDDEIWTSGIKPYLCVLFLLVFLFKDMWLCVWYMFNEDKITMFLFLAVYLVSVQGTVVWLFLPCHNFCLCGTSFNVHEVSLPGLCFFAHISISFPALCCFC